MHEEDIQTISVSGSEQIVIFQVGGKYYGLGIDHVNTIMPRNDIFEVPETSDYILGIVNMRGAMVPVMDISKRLGEDYCKDSKSSRIVITESSYRPFLGVCIDTVAETLKVSIDDIAPPSRHSGSHDMSFLRGVARLKDRDILLLDVDMLLSREEMDVIEQKRKAHNEEMRKAQ